MKAVFLTPGTGSWHCGACMRDHTLAMGLRAAGQDALLVPMYLPLHLDEPVAGGILADGVRFGGINLFLDNCCRWSKWSPPGLRRLLDNPSLLRGFSRFSNLTSAATLGETTLGMLRMDSVGMLREMERLCAWLGHESPDVICVSTALQAGMVRMLMGSTNAHVVCAFQGEDGFLDALPHPWRAACWSEMATAVAAADLRVAPSRFYADFMRHRLGEGVGRIDVLPNAVDVDAFTSRAEMGAQPVIGYLARLCEAKGLDLMVEAFIRMRSRPNSPAARLHLAGTLAPGDKALVTRLRRRISRAGLEHDVEWSPDLTWEAKVAMLGGLSLFSVPVRSPEAFGLYAIEAMAAGVPVVLPDASAFPEILGDSHAGVLVPPDDPDALADAWVGLLENPGEIGSMGGRGRRAAEANHRREVMAERFMALVSR